MTAPRDPGATPGESEFSWGEGFMPDPNSEPPHIETVHRMHRRTNQHSDNPDYVESHDGDFKARKSNPAQIDPNAGRGGGN